MNSILKYLDEFVERTCCSNPSRCPSMAECRIYSRNMVSRPMGSWAVYPKLWGSL